MPNNRGEDQDPFMRRGIVTAGISAMRKDAGLAVSKGRGYGIQILGPRPSST